MLDQVIDHQYEFASGVKLKISTTFVDSGGHYTQDVYSACRDRIYRKVFAIKGRGGNGVPYTAPPKQTSIVVQGKYLGKCWLYTLGVDAGKRAIMDSMRVKEAGAKYYHFPKRDDYGSAYFAGLLSEHLVYKQGKKQPWVWEKIPGHERNEALDCRNYANAAFKALDVNLDEIEKRLKGIGDQSPKPVKAPSAKKEEKPRRKANKGNKFFDSW